MNDIMTHSIVRWVGNFIMFGIKVTIVAADRRLCWLCYIGVVRQFLQPPQMHHEYKIKGRHELVV